MILQEYSIDDVGYAFVARCIEGIETRGLTDQGLYRVVGVNSKVQKLLQHGLGSHLSNLKSIRSFTSTSISDKYLFFLRLLFPIPHKD